MDSMQHYSTYQSQFIEMFFNENYPPEKLRKHIKVIRGVSYKPSDIKEANDSTSTIILRSNNIDEGQINFDDVVFVDSSRVSEEQIITSGDIVMCGSNGSKKLVGKAAELRIVPEVQTSFGAFCLGIRCNDSILPSYLSTYFQTSIYRDKIEAKGAGSNILNIKPDHIYDLEIPIPPVNQQMEFVKIAEQADKSKFTSLKSQFIEMFGTDTPKQKISDVCDVRGGSTPSRTNSLFWDNGDVPWFTVEDIYSQGKYIRKTKQHITKLATKKCFVYPKDTVVICCTASIGECALAKIEMASNQQFNGMMIKDRNKLDPQFLLYVSSTLKDELLRQAGKTTIHFVSRNKLEEMQIPVPSMDKQQSFVAIMEQADKSKYIN